MIYGLTRAYRCSYVIEILIFRFFYDVKNSFGSQIRIYHEGIPTHLFFKFCTFLITDLYASELLDCIANYLAHFTRLQILLIILLRVLLGSHARSRILNMVMILRFLAASGRCSGRILFFANLLYEPGKECGSVDSINLNFCFLAQFGKYDLLTATSLVFIAPLACKLTHISDVNKIYKQI